MVTIPIQIAVLIREIMMDSSEKTVAQLLRPTNCNGHPFPDQLKKLMYTLNMTGSLNRTNSNLPGGAKRM
jgi:hypothetical protein